MEATVISDLARRRLREVAARIDKADALLITASADPGLQDALAILLRWAQSVPAGYFILSSGSGNEFEAAGFAAGCIFAPHGNARLEQELRYTDWLISVRGRRIVVLECGVGPELVTLRRLGEQVAQRSTATLVRINPRESEHEESALVLKLPTAVALALLEDALPSQEELDPLPPLREFKKPVKLRIGPIRHVDLGRGLLADFNPGGIDTDDMYGCLEALMATGDAFVLVPLVGGQAAPGYGFRFREVYDTEVHRRQRRPGALVVVVSGPNRDAIMTFAIARSPETGRRLWRQLHETARTKLMPLDYPRESWVVRRPEPHLAGHAAMWPVLFEFERTLAWAWLTYQAFIDHLREAPEEE